jgi:hypothetical protein
MPGLNATAHNLMLDELGTLGTHVSAHTADPGATGTDEVTGGSYARQSVTWNAASASNLDSSNQPVIPIPASTTITHIGLWSAVSGGTFYGSWDITDEVFGSSGNYTCSDLDWNLVAV